MPDGGDQRDISMDVFRGIMLAVVTLVGIAVLAWVVLAFVHADDDLECATESAERVLQDQPPLDCD